MIARRMVAVVCAAVVALVQSAAANNMGPPRIDPAIAVEVPQLAATERLMFESEDFATWNRHFDEWLRLVRDPSAGIALRIERDAALLSGVVGARRQQILMLDGESRVSLRGLIDPIEAVRQIQPFEGCLVAGDVAEALAAATGSSVALWRERARRRFNLVADRQEDLGRYARAVDTMIRRCADLEIAVRAQSLTCGEEVANRIADHLVQVRTGLRLENALELRLLARLVDLADDELVSNQARVLRREVLERWRDLGDTLRRDASSGLFSKGEESEQMRTQAALEGLQAGLLACRAYLAGEIVARRLDETDVEFAYIVQWTATKRERE